MNTPPFTPPLRPRRHSNFAPLPCIRQPDLGRSNHSRGARREFHVGSGPLRPLYELFDMVTSIWSFLRRAWRHSPKPGPAWQIFFGETTVRRLASCRAHQDVCCFVAAVHSETCGHLGESGKNINDDIAALVKKGLNLMIQQSLDVVRVIGNEGFTQAPSI